MPFFNLPSSGSGSGGSSGPAILSGSGAPSSTLGSDGGFYLDTAAKQLYGPKVSGAWGTGIALTGALWSEIGDKPLTFAPSAHSHIIADVTGLQTALDGKQASGSYAAATHTHTIANVTGLQTALDGKQAAGSYATTVHSHAIADVTGLQTAIDGKAATSHTHALADVTGLVTALAGKQASGSYAAATHSHAIADVTGLAAAIAAKQDSGTYATLVGGTVPASQLPAFVDDILEFTTATFPVTGETGKIYTNTTTGKIFRWSGSMFIEISPSPGSTDSVTEGSANLYFTNARAVSALSASLATKAAVSHGHEIGDVALLTDTLATKSEVGHVHTISNVTGLQTALDGKQASGSYAAATHTHTASQISDLSTAVVTSVNGSAGAVTLTKSSVGLTSVDNTADASKPVSGPQATADAAIQAFAIQRANHTGTQSVGTITGLASVATAGTYSSLTGIPSTFAPSAHTHVIADVTGLQTALDGKQAAGVYATLVSSLIPVANLPKATTSAVGAVSVGSGLAVSDGVLSLEPAPGAPTSVTDNGSGTISWSASGTGTSASYEVQSTSDSGATYNAYIITNSPIATYIVLAGRKFRVRARNGVGAVSPWGYQSGLTPQVEPKNLTLGSGFTVTDGTITVSGGGGSYTLPVATASVLGGVKQGTNITIAADGTISASSGGGSYTLPVSTASVLGGVKIGSNVSVAGDGTISVAAPYSLPAATVSTLGGIIVGSGLSVSSGTVSANVTSVNGQTGAVTISGSGTYTLPNATTTTLGGVIVGTGLSVSSGTVSAAVTSVASRTGAVTLSISDIAGLQAALDDLSARIGSGGGGSTITISSQPTNQESSGGAATFSVTASASPSATLSYQWQRQALGTGSYVNISGANSATLSLTGLTTSAHNQDRYRVVVSATGAASVTSNSATLTVPAPVLSIFRDNGTSTFSAQSPFTRAASVAIGDADGLSHYSWTANASVTVTVVFTYRDDDSAGENWQIFRTRGGSTTEIYRGTDGTAITSALSVISGDVIRISSTGYPPAQFFSNVSVSAS
jgi:hypothetical protein